MRLPAEGMSTRVHVAGYGTQFNWRRCPTGWPYAPCCASGEWGRRQSPFPHPASFHFLPLLRGFKGVCQCSRRAGALRPVRLHSLPHIFLRLTLHRSPCALAFDKDLPTNLGARQRITVRRRNGERLDVDILASSSPMILPRNKELLPADAACIKIVGRIPDRCCFS